MELHAHGGGHGGVSGQTQWRSDGFARALFDARGGAARKRFWFLGFVRDKSDRGGSKNAREYRPDRVVLGGNARLAAHLGSGAPAAADLGSGARAREIAAPGEEAGAVGGVSSGRGAREDEGGRGRTGPSWVRGKKPLGLTTACRPTMCTAWSTSIFAGTSAATGMVRTTAWPASRSILRRTAGCTVILGFRESHDGANAFSRLARSSATFCAGLPAEPRRRRRHNHGT